MIREPEFRNQERRQTVHILLLEDDLISVEIVGTYLRRIESPQPEFHTAGTLAEALAFLAKPEVDLVIADLHVPDSAGAITVGDLVRVVGCPVIAITSDLNAGFREASLACGAYDFLHKSDLTEETLSRLVRLAAMQARTFHSLRESETRFRALTELSSDWYWEQDAELRFVGTSGQSSGRAGITAEAHIGLRRWELPRTEIVGETWDEHRKVLDAREPFHDLLLRRRAANGDVSYVSVDGRPIFDASGAFTGYHGVAKDVTMRIAAEMALRESEARFRSLAGLSSDLYWEQDAEFRFTAVSGTGPRIDSGRAAMVGKRRWERHYFNMTEADWTAHRADLEARRPFRDLELGRIHGGRHGVVGHGQRRADVRCGRSLRRLPRRRQGHHRAQTRGGAARPGARGHAVPWRMRRPLRPGSRRCCARFASPWAGRRAATSPSTRTPALCASAGRGPSRGRAPRSSSSARSAPSIGADRGFPGKVWESGEPLWVKDVSKEAGASGSLQGTMRGGAFVFPITSGGRTLGVMSFSSADVREPDARLLQAVGVIGSQVGQFLMRKKAERKEQRRSQDLQRFRAAMDMAHDAIYLTDRTTMRFLDVNRVGCKAHRLYARAAPGDGSARRARPVARGARARIRRGDRARRRGHPHAKPRTPGRTAAPAGASFSAARCDRARAGSSSPSRATSPSARPRRAGCGASAPPSTPPPSRCCWSTRAPGRTSISTRRPAARSAIHAKSCSKLTVGDIRVDRPRERILRDYKRLEAEPGGGDDMEISACRRKDGSVFPVEFARRLLETSDGPIIVASARDLTERLRADQRQAAVLQYQERMARFGQPALAQRAARRADREGGAGGARGAWRRGGGLPRARAGRGRARRARAGRRGRRAARSRRPCPCPPGSPVRDVLHSGARVLADGARLPFPWATALRSMALMPVRGENGVRGLLCAATRRRTRLPPRS